MSFGSTAGTDAPNSRPSAMALALVRVTVWLGIEDEGLISQVCSWFAVFQVVCLCKPSFPQAAQGSFLRTRADAP